MPDEATAAEVPAPSETPPPRTATIGRRTVRGISLAPLSDSGRTGNARHSDMIRPDQSCPVNVQSANCVRECRLEAQGFRLHDLLRVSDRPLMPGLNDPTVIRGGIKVDAVVRHVHVEPGHSPDQALREHLLLRDPI